jgi:hypothetical protein
VSYLHNDFVDTIPTRPAPLRPRLPPANTLHIVRHHAIECADEDDAARDYEAEEGRELPRSGAWVGLALLLVSACAVVALILGAVL